jgi:hypothetical protein
MGWSYGREKFHIQKAQGNRPQIMQGAFGSRVQRNNRQKSDRAAALQPGEVSQYVMRLCQESFFGAVTHDELKTFDSLNAGRKRDEVERKYRCSAVRFIGI